MNEIIALNPFLFIPKTRNLLSFYQENKVMLILYNSVENNLTIVTFVVFHSLEFQIVTKKREEK